MRWSAALLLVACSGSSAPLSPDAPPPSPDAPAAPVAITMHFERAAFLDAPFPSDDLLVGGVVKLDGFPNPGSRALTNQALGMLSGAHGFAVAGGVFFQLSGAPGPLPDLAASAADDSPVFVIAVDGGDRVPLEISFAPTGTGFGPPNRLALVPLQGQPLRAKTTYMAVVLRRLGDASGRPLAQAPEMATLAAGTRPAALPAEAYPSYQKAIAALGTLGIAADDVAALTAFTTDDPTAQIARFRDDLLARPHPQAGSFTAHEVFDDYCVFQTTIDMPDYQTGTPPYTTDGGGWTVDGNGTPILDHSETANLWVTIPRQPMPEGGYPLVVFVRTGGGGDRPIVDRGPQDANHAPLPGSAGTGPALYFAQAGFAGLSVDGPLGGLRNTTGGDEQFLVFNVANGLALRDNVRESALELVLMAHVAGDLTLDASSCPGATGAAGAHFDLGHLALMGHSTGAWIAQLVLALEPSYHAAILSGAGASWIENVLYKLEPLPVEPFLAALAGEVQLDVSDPFVTLVQWAAEPADPQAYDRRIVREPGEGAPQRNVLMEQGIVDHYILPRIANATSLSMGLDLAGTPLDAAAGLVDEPSLESLLPLVGRAPIALPASGNVGGTVTAIVVQHPADGLEDGHEVVFQTEPPKHEYRCFLTTWLASGVPRVPVGMHAEDPCP